MKTILIAIMVAILLSGCVPATQTGDANLVKLQNRIESLEASLVKANGDIVGLKTEIGTITTEIKTEVAGMKNSGDVTAGKVEDVVKQLGQVKLDLNSDVESKIGKVDTRMGNLEKSMAVIGNQYTNTGGVWVYATVVSVLIVVAACAIAIFFIWVKYRNAKKNADFFETSAAGMADAIKKSNGDKKKLKEAVKKALGDQNPKFEQWLNTRSLYAKVD